MTRASVSCSADPGALPRRNFLIVTGAAAGTAFTAPILVARAQSTAQHRIAIMTSVIPAELISETGGDLGSRLLFGALRRLGYVEGRNLEIQRYSAGGYLDRLSPVARQVVEGKPELIIAIGGPVAQAMVTATKTIPIIATFADPVNSGLVESLARPGSNITGVSVDTGVEIVGKRMQLLKDAVPSATKVAYLDVGLGQQNALNAVLSEASKRLGISVRVMRLQETTRVEYQRVFADMVQDQIGAVLISDSGEPLAFRQLIAELAKEHQLPTICAALDYVEVGGFIAYAADPTAVFQQIAEDVHQILRGESPSTIPIIQPTKFKLFINLVTAKALNLTVPAALLVGADGVIE